MEANEVVQSGSDEERYNKLVHALHNHDEGHGIMPLSRSLLLFLLGYLFDSACDAAVRVLPREVVLLVLSCAASTDTYHFKILLKILVRFPGRRVDFGEVSNYEKLEIRADALVLEVLQHIVNIRGFNRNGPIYGLFCPKSLKNPLGCWLSPNRTLRYYFGHEYDQDKENVANGNATVANAEYASVSITAAEANPLSTLALHSTPREIELHFSFLYRNVAVSYDDGSEDAGRPAPKAFLINMSWSARAILIELLHSLSKEQIEFDKTTVPTYEETLKERKWKENYLLATTEYGLFLSAFPNLGRQLNLDLPLFRQGFGNLSPSEGFQCRKLARLESQK